MPISPEKPEAPSRTHPMVTHKSADNRSPLACSVAASPPITPHASCLINIQSMPATLDIRYASERRAVCRFTYRRATYRWARRLFHDAA